MLTTDFDHGAIGTAGRSARDARPECETVARLARTHFGVSTVLITVSSSSGQELLAVAGMAPATLPPALLAACAAAGKRHETLIVVDDIRDDPRFVTEDGAGTSPESRPHFFAACALTDSGGQQIGTLYLLDASPRRLDETQRSTLRDFASLAAYALARAQAQAQAQAQSADSFEVDSNLVSLALTGSGTGLWDRNVTTGEVHYSPAWAAMLGYGPNDLSNRIEDAYLRLHPDDLAHVQATMKAHFDNRTDSYAVEHRIRCKDGSYKWICSRGKVVSRDRDGRALRMVGTTTDITALRETSQELQHTIDLITNLTNEVPGLVFEYRLTLDGRATVTYASEGIKDIYELTPEDVTRSADAIEARIDPRDVAAYRYSLQQSAANLTPWHLEYRVTLPRQGTCWRQGDARPQRLPDGSTLWHGFITDATDRKRIEADLNELATIDHLTQLPNRRHFTLRSEAELMRIRTADIKQAAVLMLDLDHFKVLNDRWGHALGDRALSHFAALLRAESRAGDIVGRIGGEEFAAVLPDATIDDAVAFARRVQRRIDEAPLVEGARQVAMTVSIGIDSLRATDVGAYQALSRCDKALYVAKERGRNRIEVYEEESMGAD